MKVTVERAALLKALGHVHRVVERRNTIPILANVLLRAEDQGLPPELAEALWRQMIGWFIQYEEEKLRQQTETKE